MSRRGPGLTDTVSDIAMSGVLATEPCGVICSALRLAADAGP